MKISFLHSLGVIALMAACSGGGGSNGGTGGGTGGGGAGGGGTGGGGGVNDNVPSFANAAAVIADGETSLDAITPLGLTDPADFQRSGNATFDGTLVVNDSTTGPANASVLGGMRVTVDFANSNNVTGEAGNFFDLADSAVGGSLTLDNVEFSEGTAGGGFVGDLSGVLTNVGRTGSDETYDYDLEVGALYYGSGVQAIIGILDGSATEDGTSATRDVTGAATLERN